MDEHRPRQQPGLFGLNHIHQCQQLSRLPNVQKANESISLPSTTLSTSRRCHSKYRLRPNTSLFSTQHIRKRLRSKLLPSSETPISTRLGLGTTFPSIWRGGRATNSQRQAKITSQRHENSPSKRKGKGRQTQHSGIQTPPPPTGDNPEANFRLLPQSLAGADTRTTFHRSTTPTNQLKGPSMLDGSRGYPWSQSVGLPNCKSTKLDQLFLFWLWGQQNTFPANLSSYTEIKSTKETVDFIPAREEDFSNIPDMDIEQFFIHSKRRIELVKTWPSHKTSPTDQGHTYFIFFYPTGFRTVLLFYLFLSIFLVANRRLNWWRRTPKEYGGPNTTFFRPAINLL